MTAETAGKGGILCLDHAGGVGIIWLIMSRYILCFACFIAMGSLACTQSLHAEIDWAEIIETEGLTKVEVESLRTNKMVVSGRQIRQVFGPYAMMRMPVFITSDGVLSGFNGLVQESLRFLELRQVSHLESLLQIMQGRIASRMEAYKATYGKVEATEVGIHRARLLLAVAQNLIGDSKAIPIELQAEAREAAILVGQEKGIFLPAWLGKPTAEFQGIDATRFSPVSFYAGDQRLARCFKSITWLQSIPLLINDDASLVSVCILVNAMHAEEFSLENYERDRQMVNCLRTFDRFFGMGGILGVAHLKEVWPFNYDHVPETKKNSDRKASLDERRMKILEALSQLKPTQTPNDLLTSRVGVANVRFWPSSEMPDHRYFQSVADFEPVSEGRFVRGLEVAAALGSMAARSEILKTHGNLEAQRRFSLAEDASFQAGLRPPKEIDGQDTFGTPAPAPGQPIPPVPEPKLGPPSDMTNWDDESSFYQRYMSCLAALLDTAEPDAPAVFSSNAWQSKSCQTVLAGWAQMRHTAALHARHEVHALCAPPNEPGYVEPDPSFFEMLGNLTAQWHEAFSERQTFSMDMNDVERAMREDFTDVFNEQSPDKILAEERLSKAPWPEIISPPKWTPIMVGGIVVPESIQDDDATKHKYYVERRQQQEAEYWKSVIVWQKAAQKWFEEQAEAGGLPAAFLRHYESERNKLNQRWQQFLVLCRQLEAIAHKQLRGQPFSDTQREFMFVYGPLLGGLMGYDGSTYLSPRDDAAICSQILHDPQSGIRRHVGLGRPRIFYILYPTKNGEVLLRGAVNTYEERDAQEPLTDSAWRERLDQEPNSSPPWLQIIQPDKAQPLREHDW